jgi:hypothetical protein
MPNPKLIHPALFLDLHRLDPIHSIGVIVGSNNKNTITILALRISLGPFSSSLVVSFLISKKLLSNIPYQRVIRIRISE